jgi:hypothetical protein
MSGLLRAIELGLFDRGEDAETLFLPIAGNEGLLRDMNRIIDLWQSATGDRVKERPAQPARVPGLPVSRRAAAPAGGGGVATAAGGGGAAARTALGTLAPPASGLPASGVPVTTGAGSPTAQLNGHG